MSRVIYGIHTVRLALTHRPGDVQSIAFARGAKNHGGGEDNDRHGALAELAALAARHGLKPQQFDRAAIEKQAGSREHQGVVARLAEFQYASDDDVCELIRAAHEAGERAVFVALDGIQDPQNLGALLRTAAALGVKAAVIPKDRACPVTPVVEKAAAGATFVLPVARVTNLTRFLEQAKEAGGWTVAAVMDGDPLDKCPKNYPAVIVVGGEGQGVRPGVLKACDIRAAIPLAGQVEALNASVAGAIIVWEWVR